MKYKVSVIKKIAFLVMTMALAVAMVACQGAAGVDGKDAKSPGVAPQTVNGGLADQSVEVGKTVPVADLSQHFTDPNGDDGKLKYTAASSAPTVATVKVTGKSLAITGVKAGMATITVTATDGEGLNTKSTAKVTVTTPPTEPTTPPTEPTTPTTPTPTPTPGENMTPTVSTILPQTMMVGGVPLAVDVSPFFTDPDGDALTFSDAASSDPTVATVALSVSTLTITAVTAGTSTISVTATDPGGLYVKGMVTLTVSDPTKPPAISLSAEMDLDIALYLTDSQKAADYVVVSSNGSIFTAVLKKGSVWTLTPKSHGMADAKIQHKNTAAEVESIPVTVPNREPTLNPKASTVKTVELVNSATGAGNNTNDPVDKTGLGADALQVYKATADLTDQFMDPDGVDKTKLTYAITPSRSDVIISKGASCKTDMCALEIDVLTKAAATYFELTVVASDPGGLMSKELVIPVDSNDPLEQMYATGQLDDRFRPITVGHRESKHTLTFGTYDAGVFKFVDTHIASLTAAEAALTTPTGATFATTGDVLLGKPSDLKVQDQDGDTASTLDNPDHMIYVESSGTVAHGTLMNSVGTPVVLSSTAFATGFLDGTIVDDDPKLEFTVVGSSGSGMITLTHYVWAATTDTTKAKWVKSAPVTLKVTVNPVK